MRLCRACYLTGLAFLFAAELLMAHSEEGITAAAVTFIEGLEPQNKSTAQFDMDNPARRSWTNLPVGLVPRQGLRYGELSDASRVRFHDLLTTVLSSQGYLKVTSIMQLDDILNNMFKQLLDTGKMPQDRYERIRALDWDYENFFIAVWGQPGEGHPWGLKLEGHHISLNLSSDGTTLAMTPLFLGSDPAQVEMTRHAGLRVLAKEEDLGLRLVNALSEEQKAIATLSREVPSDIITNPKANQRLQQSEGIAWDQLDATQQKMLMKLIDEYLGNVTSEKRSEYWARLEAAGLDGLHFAWIGGYQRGEAHYYVINGPGLLIEYDNISQGGQGANHIHTIWREPGNDFGEDLLRRHYETAGHHNELKDFATGYAAAWSSQDPERLASHYAPDGSLSVNGGVASVGHEAIAEKARGFMAAYPDMKVKLVQILGQGRHATFHWRWTGTNTGPGGNGHSVDIQGYEIWTLDEQGKIQQSLGNYDAAEFARQGAIHAN